MSRRSFSDSDIPVRELGCGGESNGDAPSPVLGPADSIMVEPVLQTLGLRTSGAPAPAPAFVIHPAPQPPPHLAAARGRGAAVLRPDHTTRFT